MRFVLTLLFFTITLISSAQFAPPVGQAGTTAIFKDNSMFQAWATACSITRGLQDISDPSLGFVTVGDSSMAVGMAGSNGIVSLGDGGSATLTFTNPISNGAGYDFAVFENGFDDHFLELAFVEVSSDGINFFRFNSISLTDTSSQTDSFDSTDATKINNMAGKYRGFYGTPFDLEEMKNILGLDVNLVTHIKIIDVVGSMQNEYATFDSNGNKVNDPWPTPFPSGGFDLDAVGVINSVANTISEENQKNFDVYPNPIRKGGKVFFDLQQNEMFEIRIFSGDGKDLGTYHMSGSNHSIDLSALQTGIYFLKISGQELNIYKKIIISE